MSDDCVDCFNKVLSFVIDNMASVHKLRVRNESVPWINNILLIITDNIAHRKALKICTPEAWSYYRMMRNKTNINDFP